MLKRPRLGLVGGGLQGVEAAYLAGQLGWSTVLVESRPRAPAAGLVDAFINRRLATLADCEKCFRNCDLILPACEDLPTLRLLTQWRQKSGQPLAFHLPSYLVSSDKAASKALFSRAAAPTPGDWPEAPWPLMAKPVGLSGSRGVRLLAGPAEFQAAFPNPAARAGWILEEYCPGPSYSLEITGRPGAYHSWQVTALEMDEVYDCRQVRAPSGLTAAVEDEFRRISLAIAEHLELTGLMDVEVILTPSGFKVLEIDARLPSQTPAVVWLATGRNLLAELAEVFLPGVRQAARAMEPPRAVIYEHVEYRDGRLRTAGEHIMTGGGPLTRRAGLLEADEALTNYRPGASSWVAALMYFGDDQAELEARRRQQFSL